MTWTIPDLWRLLVDLDESERIEAKRGLGKSTRETVSAFANEPEMRGGWLLFGVERGDDGLYRVVGVPEPDRLQADLATQCREMFNRVIRPEIRVERLEGQVVVAAYIAEADARDKPIYLVATGLPKGAYRRIGSVDQRCTDDDLALFASRGQRVPFDRRAVPGATSADLDPDAVALFRRQVHEQRPGSELNAATDDDFLLSVNAVTHEGAAVVPTHAGLLFLGRKLAIRRFFPGLTVDYIRVRGTAWTGEDGDTYSTLEVREALVTGWRRLYAAVLDDLATTVTVRDASPLRQDTTRLPERVIREGVVNALVHRDYEINSSIQLRRFANRLEMTNPGASLVPPDDLGRPYSLRRNPTLAELFVLIGVAEAKGTGVRRMRERMRADGLSAPIFESDRGGGFFTLTLLFRHFLDDADLAWIRSRGAGSDPTDLQVLVFARDNGKITNAELRAFSGDDTLAASARLGRLRNAGQLVQHGTAKQSTWYTLADAGPVVEAQLTLDDAAAGPSRVTQSGSDQVERPSRVTQSTGELSPEHQAIITAAETPRTLTELMAVTALKHRTNFRRNYIQPLVESGRLRMTVPDRPNSRLQKYVAVAAPTIAPEE